MSATSTSGSNDDLNSRKQQPMLASQRAKEQAPRESRTGRLATLFPLGYKEAASQWWASITPAAAEHKVLSFIPYLKQAPTHTQTGTTPVSVPTDHPISTENGNAAAQEAPVTTKSVADPYGPRTWRSNLVKLSGRNRGLNEFSVERDGEEVEENLVILHGYGAGLGFFYRNFEGLSRPKGWKLWALDLLGMGRSTRPHFSVKAKDPEGKIKEAEDWFIDALEEWRLTRNIDRFTLIGHSLGGYMAVAYALKYPGHLKKLILASPVGIPEDPYAMNAAMPDPNGSTLANEYTQSESEIMSQSNPNIPDSAKRGGAGDGNNFLNARSKAEKEAAAKGNPPNSSDAPRKPLPKWLTYLWDANISPFSVVRWGGPLGPRFVSGWTTRRFSHLPPQEAQALHDYSYSLFRQRGSGEYALAYILAPGAFARSPLIKRIHGVGRQVIADAKPAAAGAAAAPATATAPAQQQPRRETGIPLVLMYGENDWMDVAGGYAAAEAVEAEKRRVAASLATEAERRADGGSAKVVIIRQAGHHLYLDGSEEFNEVVREEMEDVSRRGRGA